ncbi:preprotein translocase subunit YajC [Nocardia sp. 004]|uniref:preprotein translocase subunit YajC n=1 Tax=Nocardia sp. 004 TaxID=3385978 RepID=UPI0039A145BF
MELLFPLLLVALLVPMFLGVRRQKREAEKIANMQDTLKIGDQVITTSGLYGTVVDLDDTTVDLEIAEDVITTWLRRAIHEVRVDDQVSTEEADTSETGSGDSSAAEITEETAEQTQTRLTKD